MVVPSLRDITATIIHVLSFGQCTQVILHLHSADTDGKETQDRQNIWYRRYWRKPNSNNVFNIPEPTFSHHLHFVKIPTAMLKSIPMFNVFKGSLEVC